MYSSYPYRETFAFDVGNFIFLTSTPLFWFCDAFAIIVSNVIAAASCILPGFVRITNSQGNRTPEELDKWYKEIAKRYPMRRVCEVEEIANVVAFLASEKSSYINGQSINMDGGRIITDYHDF